MVYCAFWPPRWSAAVADTFRGNSSGARRVIRSVGISPTAVFPRSEDGASLVRTTYADASFGETGPHSASQDVDQEADRNHRNDRVEEDAAGPGQLLVITHEIRLLHQTARRAYLPSNRMHYP